MSGKKRLQIYLRSCDRLSGHYVNDNDDDDDDAAAAAAAAAADDDDESCLLP